MWRVCERAGLQGAPDALVVTAGRAGRRYGMGGIGEVGAGVTSYNSMHYASTPPHIRLLSRQSSSGHAGQRQRQRQRGRTPVL